MIFTQTYLQAVLVTIAWENHSVYYRNCSKKIPSINLNFDDKGEDVWFEHACTDLHRQI